MGLHGSCTSGERADLSTEGPSGRQQQQVVSCSCCCAMGSLQSLESCFAGAGSCADHL